MTQHRLLRFRRLVIQSIHSQLTPNTIFEEWPFALFNYAIVRRNFLVCFPLISIFRIVLISRLHAVNNSSRRSSWRKLLYTVSQYFSCAAFCCRRSKVQRENFADRSFITGLSREASLTYHTHCWFRCHCIIFVCNIIKLLRISVCLVFVPCLLQKLIRSWRNVWRRWRLQIAAPRKTAKYWQPLLLSDVSGIRKQCYNPYCKPNLQKQRKCL